LGGILIIGIISLREGGINFTDNRAVIWEIIFDPGLKEKIPVLPRCQIENKKISTPGSKTFIPIGLLQDLEKKITAAVFTGRGATKQQLEY